MPGFDEEYRAKALAQALPARVRGCCNQRGTNCHKYQKQPSQ